MAFTIFVYVEKRSWTITACFQHIVHLICVVDIYLLFDIKLFLISVGHNFVWELGALVIKLIEFWP